MMYGIFTLIGVIGTIATTFLPETKDQNFPECLADVEEQKQYPFWSWAIWKVNNEDNLPGGKINQGFSNTA